jgi:hypothetical protein
VEGKGQGRKECGVGRGWWIATSRSEQRGLAEGTVERIRKELERCGSWAKRRRPRPSLEQIDAPVIVAYVEARMASGRRRR